MLLVLLAPLLFGLLSQEPNSKPAASSAPEPQTASVVWEVAREEVLGTSMRMRIHSSPDAKPGLEAAVLEEIGRVSAIVSSWDPASELSKLPVGQAVHASEELRDLVKECNAWTKSTHGAFDPGVAGLSELWAQSAAAGREPTEAEIGAALKAISHPAFEVDNFDETIERRATGPIGLDGAAKGFILDAAKNKALVTGAEGGLIDIGGDLVVFGKDSEIIGVADPKHPADNAPTLVQVRIQDAAIATSGGYARGWQIGGRHYSHILDPATGRPAEHVLQATVVAPSAMLADLLATAFNIMDPRDSVRLCARNRGVETLILTEDGARYQSAGWEALEVHDGAPAAALKSALALGGEIQVTVELARIAQGQGGERRREGGYKRPYVAVWVENASGQPVRTLSLWIERDRWISDLRQWSRMVDHKADAIQAVTRATRGPGTYTLAFDGRNDQGEALPAGTYSLLIEAAREHGTYQLQQQELILDGRALHFTLNPGSELGMAKVDYEPPVAK
ncbi:MAG: DUF2271 domain-containing protein [Planctomycetes bacterium]|nr:DUF2271 domain-containing protein [Planctomycetota bacterium]MCB9909816.1 DUF2271 domain-containing protein [Planctomycetota bacterium]MCB9912274.1 DUF2271 domain-containing protein [Planctomycetota bacterium]HPF13515.1 DUF2271 domain-containing protein [Planctomycetota bacterium]HRV80690.1 DUF2271 domain-containing protein [Planctomycetota bacterium]